MKNKTKKQLEYERELRLAMKAIAEGEKALREGKTRSFAEFAKEMGFRK